MNDFLPIQSRQNPRLKHLVKLVEQRKARQEQGGFVVEGAFEVAQALRAGISLGELYVTPPALAANAELVGRLRAAYPAMRCFALEEGVFEKASQRQGPDGLLAVAVAPQASLDALVLPHNPLLLVAEKVEKPGNLGALIRSAEAAGANALICCDPVVDFYNPHVIRNSRGLVFHLPCVAASSAQVAAFLRQRGIDVVATTPDATLTHWDCDMRGAVAVLAGAEHEGLSPFWLEQANRRVRIPMTGQADSLNVNVASALVLFEALRQRQSRTTAQ